MTVKKPFGTFKEFAWEIWLRPHLAFCLFCLIVVGGWLLYGIIFYRFLTGDHVITGVPELIVEIVSRFQGQSTQHEIVSWEIMIIGLFVHVGVPALLFCGLVGIWHLIVYPTKQKIFLQHVNLFKATETKHLLRKLLIKGEEELCKIFESARGHGAYLPIDKIKEFVVDYIELTNSDKIMMTTLYSPSELYSDTALKAAVGSLTRTIIKEGKSLTRICIGDKSDFNKDHHSDAIKWFDEIHRIGSKCEDKRQEIKIVYVPRETVKLNGTDEINSRADVLVLGESVAFALGTNKDTIKVPSGNEFNEFRLFLLESAHDIEAYRRFFDNLLENDETTEYLLQECKHEL